METEEIYSKVSIFSLTIIAAKFLKNKIKIDEYFPEDVNDEIIEEVRYYILNKLNQCKDVYDIKDVLSEEDIKRYVNYLHTTHGERFNIKNILEEEKYPIFSFRPIIFSYKLPLALQDELFSRDYPNEEYRIIIDGVSIFILGKSPLNKIPSGIPDVRDKIMEILNEPNELICKIIGLGFRRQFVFTEDINLIPLDINTYVYSKDKDITDYNLKQLYIKMFYLINELLELHESLNEIEDYVETINNIKEEILQNLLSYIRISSWHILSKNRYSNKTEEMLINSFYLYNQFIDKLKLYKIIKNRTITENNSKDTFFIDFLDNSIMNNYLEPTFDEKLYLDTYSKTFDIIQKYSLNKTTIVAGIIGGLLVFFITGVLNILPYLINLFKNIFSIP